MDHPSNTPGINSPIVFVNDSDEGSIEKNHKGVSPREAAQVSRGRISRSLSTSSSGKFGGRFSLKDVLKSYNSETPSLTSGISSPLPPITTYYLQPRPSKGEKAGITSEDEIRIVDAIISAAKKKTTGSVFSVKVDISSSGTLGIGVKDLPGDLLALSTLIGAGAGEAAGLCLGDIVFGINFLPAREGSKTLLKVLKRAKQKHKKSVYLQCWRCHQLCSESIPGALFPKADDVIVQAHFLYHTKVFSDWERWNFIEILSSNMLEDMKLRAALDSYQTAEKKAVGQKKLRSRQNQLLDLQRNILQAKGLRNALCVRVVHTKTTEDAVAYVLRVEDVETGLQWMVNRRYRDFYALNTELMDMTIRTKEISFPKKTISLGIRPDSLIERRIVQLEHYVRKVLHTLTVYGTMEPSASRALRHIQNFLGVETYIDCIHPPPLDDQRFVELMAYRFLNESSSPACQQCVQFVTTVVLEDMVEVGSEEGYRPVLEHMKKALAEVERFVLQHHEQQMVASLGERNHLLDVDQCKTFVRRCVRRQVEAAIYLPLRRSIFKIMFPFIASQGHDMQSALAGLRSAHPKYFSVDSYVPKAKLFPAAIQSFRDVILAYLPADQGQLLLKAAGAVMELYAECKSHHRTKQERRESLASSSRTESHSTEVATPSTSPSRQLSGILSASGISAEEAPDSRTNSRTTSQEEEGRGSNSNSKGSSSKNRANTGHLRYESVHPYLANPPRISTHIHANNSIRMSTGPDGSVTLSMGDRASLSRATLVVPRLASEVGRMSSRGVAPGPGEEGDEDDPFSKLYTIAEDREAGDEEEEAGLFDRLQTTSGRNLSHIDGCNLTEGDHDSVLMFGRLRSQEGQTAEEAVAEVAAAATAAAQAQFESRRRGLTVFERISEEDEEVDGGDGEIMPALTLGGSEEEEYYRGTDMEGPGGYRYYDDHMNRDQRGECSTVDQMLNRMNVIPAHREERVPAYPHIIASHRGSSDGFGVDPTEVAVIPENHAQLAQGEQQGELGAQESLVRVGGRSPSRQSFLSGGGDRDGDIDSGVVKKLSSRPNHILSMMDFESDGNSSDIRNSICLMARAVDDELDLGDHDIVAATLDEEKEEQPAEPKRTVVSADDFLPLFTYVLVQADMPQLVLVKELMTSLVDDEETYGELGYYMATMEAAIYHVTELAKQHVKQSQRQGNMFRRTSLQDSQMQGFAAADCDSDSDDND